MRELVIFSLGGSDYALPMGAVQEIIRYTQPRSVSGEQPWLAGVISLRGKIVPVCDLARRIGLAHSTTDDAKIAIVDTVDGTAGIIVDDVTEVLAVNGEDVDPLPATSHDCFDAVAKLEDGRLVVLLEPNALFEGVEFAAASRA